MAISYAGGTDRVRWDPIAVSTTGCVAFMMRTTQTTVNACPLASWSLTSRNGYGFIINNTANKVTAQGYDSSAARVILVSTTTINDGNWHHVAFNYNTANGGANALFVDGAQEASANSSAAWTKGAGQSLYSGDNVDTFWPSYVGELAQISTYSGVNLDASEIAALAKGFSAMVVRPAALAFHIPGVEDVIDIWRGLGSTVTGTTFSPHCRIAGRP